MKNSLFLIIAVMTLTLLVGCQRNQTVNTSKDEFSKDSCMIVTFTDDTVQFRYQLIADSIEIKMANSVQKVFLADLQKHSSFILKDVHVSDDIIEDCRGKSFGVFDSVNYTLYKFQFVKSPKFILSDKLSVIQESVVVSKTTIFGRVKVE